jgi:plastocyanin
MRKTGRLVWLVCGVFACACSSSSSRKDASIFDGGARDHARNDGAEFDGGESEVGESEVGTGEVGAGEVGAGGDAAAEDANIQSAVITITSGLLFATPSLVVPAGTTITVQNQDTVPHTVTSETAPNTFQPSGAFDTGVIPGGGSATITLPADAMAGTIFYFYCSIHASLMVPPNGTITIR